MAVPGERTLVLNSGGAAAFSARFASLDFLSLNRKSWSLLVPLKKLNDMSPLAWSGRLPHDGDAHAPLIARAVLQ